MENSTNITSFILAAFGEMGQIRYFYFSVILMLYLAIIFTNSFLIGVIFAERNLHEPMYFFLCNLAINEVYGSTGLFPSLLANILSSMHDISRDYCIVQIFCLHTYGTIEFSTLAVMAYDRYVSICCPLQYNAIMTPSKVCAFIALTWLYSVSRIILTLILTLALPLCGNIIEKVYCDNYSLVRLACIDTTINNIYGMIGVVLSIIIPLLLILYSYAKVLRICLKASKESQFKALNTCTPHLVSLVNFSVGCFFEIVQSRFNMKHVPYAARIIISVYFLIFPPLLNPIIYGVRITQIRLTFKKMLCITRLFPELDSTECHRS
ncbi:olfactory receptor 4B13-like [Amia ocellicauda]|uniref:olfactory receptor 4B13-like n=1 Tax=Amia ocellicauda TaxID=2972642 RepID=UPI00346402EA